MADILLTHPRGTCRIIVAESIQSEMIRLLHKRGIGRVFLMTDTRVAKLHARSCASMLRASGLPVELLTVPPGEASKSLRTYADLTSRLLKSRISRDDLILAMGGGVVTDLAGFVAATILRSVEWWAIPTTLLGMVDAAIGGKTGINHAAGKNLIGAYWQPTRILCGTEYLATLPEREIVAGCGEIVKYAALSGGSLAVQSARLLQSGKRERPVVTASLIAACIRYKARVVSSDERDAHGRMVLNFGHTFAHAFEKAAGFGKLPHGMAVALGCHAAVSLSRLSGGHEDAFLASYQRTLEQLMTRIPHVSLSPVEVVQALSLDKKRTGGKVRFILLRRMGEPYITSDVTITHVRTSVKQMLRTYAQLGGRDAKTPRRSRS